MSARWPEDFLAGEVENGRAWRTVLLLVDVAEVRPGATTSVAVRPSRFQTAHWQDSPHLLYPSHACACAH
jgi:hypothetical protein